jgi:hypothetical protein
MPIDIPDIIPSPVDPDYECVRKDLLVPEGELAEPPTDQQTEESLPKLCPEGYVPRRRRRPYKLDGKRVQTGQPPERNPDAPCERDDAQRSET